MKNPPVFLAGSLAGFFKMEAIRPDGSRRMLADWFPNLILNQGLNHIGVGGIGTSCQVGAGSTAPVITDSGMESFIAGTARSGGSSGYQSTDPWYGYDRGVYRFAAGAAAGNLSEVGVGWGESGTTLFSRALILDGLGAPTTITVLGDEVLDVSYEIRIYPPAADQTYNVDIGGITHAVTLRAASLNTGSWQPNGMLIYGSTFGFQASTHEGPLGTKFESPSGLGGGGANCVMATYSNNSLKRDGALVAGLDDYNIAGGIGAILMNSNWGGAYQASFTPKILKDNTKVMNLNLSIAWARR